MTARPYALLKQIHRTLRKKVKSIFRPEVSQRKIHRFLKLADKVQANLLLHPKNPSIAIVVPCYGHAFQIPEMFTSITTQTRPADQVIFVIDQSPDNSAQILQDLIGKLPTEIANRYQIFYNPSNMGQAASINNGVDNAATDLVMVLNDDDYLMHDCIEVVLGIFSRYPQASLVGGHSLHFSSDQLIQLPKNIREIQDPETIEIDLRTPKHTLQYRGYNDLNMTHSGSCFYKKVWQIAGMYYPDHPKRIVPFSDRDFQLRVNALFTVALSNSTPLSCWRNDSSVDQGVNS